MLRKRALPAGAQEDRGEACEMNDALEAIAGFGEPVACGRRHCTWIYADQDDDEAVIR